MDSGAGEGRRESARFLAILDELWALHTAKNADYGLDDDPYANVRASVAWGVPAWVGGMIRACDKVRRLMTYAIKGTLRNEGVRDSFLDLAAYAIIACILWEDEQAD